MLSLFLSLNDFSLLLPEFVPYGDRYFYGETFLWVDILRRLRSLGGTKIDSRVLMINVIVAL